MRRWAGWTVLAFFRLCISPPPSIGWRKMAQPSHHISIRSKSEGPLCAHSCQKSHDLLQPQPKSDPSACILKLAYLWEKASSLIRKGMLCHHATRTSAFYSKNSDVCCFCAIKLFPAPLLLCLGCRCASHACSRRQSKKPWPSGFCNTSKRRGRPLRQRAAGTKLCF